MAFWWVNHKQTRKHEVRGGYLWSPLRNANGARNQTYDNMRFAQPGDIVFSYAHGEIGAVGRVTVAATACPKPHEFGDVGHYWSEEGWMVEVDFREAPFPLSPKKVIGRIGPLLPDRYSPLQKSGNGNQSCYLAAISDALGGLLFEWVAADHIADFRHSLSRQDLPTNPTILKDLDRIEHDDLLTATQRIQLGKARVGQGLFRKRVILLNGCCPVTGVDDPRVLIASHIKPWREADNGERMNGYNGLLLSPHVDALFDNALMTFDDDGHMRIHPSLPPSVLERWSIDPNKPVEKFRPEQAAFLGRHRTLFAAKVG